MKTLFISAVIKCIPFQQGFYSSYAWADLSKFITAAIQFYEIHRPIQFNSGKGLFAFQKTQTALTAINANAPLLKWASFPSVFL